jgi:hypothetical protein
MSSFFYDGAVKVAKKRLTKNTLITNYKFSHANDPAHDGA